MGLGDLGLCRSLFHVWGGLIGEVAEGNGMVGERDENLQSREWHPTESSFESGSMPAFWSCRGYSDPASQGSHNVQGMSFSGMSANPLEPKN